MKIGITERGDAALHYKEVLESASKKKVSGIVLITKDPALLERRMKILPPAVPFVIHCTITGLGGSELEPKVPRWHESIESYYSLINDYGSLNVILRVDPIFLNSPYQECAESVLRCARGLTRISFVDAYAHVRKRFQERDIDERYLPNDFHYSIGDRRKFVEYCRTLTDNGISICSEPGLESSGCISRGTVKALGLKSFPYKAVGYQRSECKCLESKVELLGVREPCKHNCAYCYWKDK